MKKYAVLKKLEVFIFNLSFVLRKSQVYSHGLFKKKCMKIGWLSQKGLEYFSTQGGGSTKI